MAVLDPHIVVGIAQRNSGAGQHLAAGAEDGARERHGFAELEIVGDFFGVVAKAEQLGG